jgi:hypothetical protein
MSRQVALKRLLLDGYQRVHEKVPLVQPKMLSQQICFAIHCSMVVLLAQDVQFICVAKYLC